MKLNKILSLVLSGAMFVATLPVTMASAEERVIYEDNFDNYTGLVGSVGSVPVRKSIFKEDSGFKTESKYSKYSLLTDENNPENKWIQLDSSYITLGSQSAYCPTSMEYLPDEELLTKENQMEKGNLKLSFSLRLDGTSDKHEATSLFKVISAESMEGDLTDIKLTMFGIGAAYQNGELKGAIQSAEKDYDRTKLLLSNEWYDVELVYDLIGNNLNTNVVRQADGTVVKNFDHKLNWCAPFGAATPEEAREYNAIRNILFKVDKGLKVSIDNFKLEYFLEKPEISPKDIVVTDYRGVAAEDLEVVSPAVVSVKLPFGTIMSPETTNEETVLLKDSDGNNVEYVPEYTNDAYILKPSNCLDINETYTVYIPETVENIFGESFGRELSFSFKTTGKKPEFMAIESVKIGDTEVSDLSEIINGETIDVYVEYANNSQEEIDSLVSISYYDDNRLLYTKSVKGETVLAGEMGADKISFNVPSEGVFSMSMVDRVSVCLWESFEKSIAYVASFEVGENTFDTTEVTKTKPTVTYSYSESKLNIQGVADENSKYVTVQILMPGCSFDNADEMSEWEADSSVLYRGQAPVIDGAYSVDIRFDVEKNEDSFVESGTYPARIFVDDEKVDIDEIYITSYSDFLAEYNALNDAAENDDFEEFKRIINEERNKLNFVVDFAEEAVLDEEISSYFEYVKENPLDTDDEAENIQIFKTYALIEYINGGKLDNVQDYTDELLIDEKIKELCTEMIYDEEVGEYFSELISENDIDDIDEFEDVIKEGLILTTVKYGNGYGALKSVLEECGDVLGIDKPISTTACKALMGDSFDDGDDFKEAYNKKASSSSGGGSSSGGSSSGGKGKGNSTGSFSIGAVNPEMFEKQTLVPVAKEFEDIDNYEWATESILGLADLGIISGVSENRFAPSRNVLREEFAKIIVGALNMTEYNYGENIFKDANAASWFTSYINIAADLGVARGIGDGYFGAGQNITRQDMAVMIYNALKFKGVDMVSGELHFEDRDKIADYAKPAVSALYNMGAINGVSETSFDPISFATRAEAAKMVYGVIGQLQG